MDRFEEMQTFVRVVDAGGLSAAARRLDIARSAVSRRLADLEARLGVQLLTRTTRRINLTEHGRAFYERCVALLAELEETERAVSSGHKALRGTLRIAAPLSFGIKHLSPLLDDFLKTHPDLTLDLDLNDRTVNLMEEGVDLAVRIGNLNDSTLVARRLARVRRILCASPEYLARYGEPGRPEDLGAHVGLLYTHMSETQHWQFQRADTSWVSVSVPTRMRANNGDILLKAAIDGLGVLGGPTFICYEAIAQGLLQPILCDYELPQSAVYVMYPRQRHLPQRLRVLINHLAASLGDEPYWDAPIRTLIAP